MAKTYKLNRTHNPGNVVFIVEGGRPGGGTELRLLKRIFVDLLGYHMEELRRGTDEFIGYRGNQKSRIIGLNLPQNQITGITPESVNRLFARLHSEFPTLKPENMPIFLLYDRDPKSYHKNELRRYVRRYADPYYKEGSKEAIQESGFQGQLLLSYPSVESYLVSCRCSGPYEKLYELGKDLKPDARSWGCSVEAIESDEQLIHAAQEMDAELVNLGCGDYDLDDLGKTLLAAYDAQQIEYREKGGFSLLSQISLALLELGVLVEDVGEVAAT